MSPSRQNSRAGHIFFILYVVAMVLVFLLPVASTPILRSGQSDKVAHFGIFLGFALLYRLDRRPSPVWTLLVSFAFAGGIELVQWPLPYRSPEWSDFLAGCLGAGMGTVLSFLARTPTNSRA